MVIGSRCAHLWGRDGYRATLCPHLWGRDGYRAALTPHTPLWGSDGDSELFVNTNRATIETDTEEEEEDGGDTESSEEEEEDREEPLEDRPEDRPEDCADGGSAAQRRSTIETGT